MNDKEKLKTLEDAIKSRYAYLLQVEKHARTLIKEPQLSHYWSGKSYAIDNRANREAIDPKVLQGFADELDGYTGELANLEKLLSFFK